MARFGSFSGPRSPMSGDIIGPGDRFSSLGIVPRPEFEEPQQRPGLPRGFIPGRQRSQGPRRGIGGTAAGVNPRTRGGQNKELTTLQQQNARLFEDRGVGAGRGGIPGSTGSELDLNGFLEALSSDNFFGSQQQTIATGTPAVFGGGFTPGGGSDVTNFLEGDSANDFFNKQFQADLFSSLLPFLSQDQRLSGFNALTGLDFLQPQSSTVPSLSAFNRLGKNL